MWNSINGEKERKEEGTHEGKIENLLMLDWEEGERDVFSGSASLPSRTRFFLLSLLLGLIHILFPNKHS